MNENERLVDQVDQVDAVDQVDESIMNAVPRVFDFLLLFFVLLRVFESSW